MRHFLFSEEHYKTCKNNQRRIQQYEKGVPDKIIYKQLIKTNRFKKNHSVIIIATRHHVPDEDLTLESVFLAHLGDIPGFAPHQR